MTLPTYALTIGTVCLLFGIPMAVSPGKTTKWIIGVMENDAMLRVIGAIFLVLSLLVLRDDATIGTDPAGLVRLLAWATGVKSLIMCWWPEWMLQVSRRMLTQSWCQACKCIGSLAFGVLLLWAGMVL